MTAADGPATPAADQAAAMDRMYRLTRHVYDLTRAYYLLGRDRMLAQVVTSPSTATLEVGCGTARNLIKLARRPEPGLLCGLDASQEMLDTAAASIHQAVRDVLTTSDSKTPDLGGKATTEQVGIAVMERLK